MIMSSPDSTGIEGTDPIPDASNIDVTPNSVDPGADAANRADPVTESLRLPSFDAPDPGNPLDPYGLLDQALAERKTLVEVCLYALDRARSSGVAQRIEHELARVGVVAVRPDGEPFDPAHHEAAGTVPTADAALDGRVAETEEVGFTDHGRSLRAPVVTVYQHRAEA
jgi:hypothetical protein